jgi:hypothetical protein
MLAISVSLPSGDGLPSRTIQAASARACPAATFKPGEPTADCTTPHAYGMRSSRRVALAPAQRARGWETA